MSSDKPTLTNRQIARMLRVLADLRVRLKRKPVLEEISLPALAEENDPIGRPVGAPLCPQLQTLEALLTERRVQGSYSWSSVYQQRPVPLGGGLFKREHIRRYRRDGSWLLFQDAPERHSLNTVSKFITVDTATSEKTSADYTAVTCWGSTMGANDLVLLDMDIRRIEGFEIDTAIRSMCLKWSTTAWIEETTGSAHLLSFLKTGMTNRDGSPRPPLAFRTLKADRSKVARAIPATALCEQGRVVFPMEHDFLALAERQLFAFTGTGLEHDDFVDAFAYAAQVFA